MIAVIQTVWRTYFEFFGFGGYAAWTFGALFVLLVHEKDKENRRIFLRYALLFALIYAFPLTAWIIMRFCIGELVYWRMFWLLPIPVMIAYVLTSGLFQISDKRRRGLVLFLVLGGIAVTGSRVYAAGNFVKAENAYKLDSHVPAVCEVIRTDASARQEEVPGVIVPDELVCQIRQYDASIRMPYGRNALRGEKVTKLGTRIYQIMSTELNAGKLAHYAKKGGYFYLVYPAGVEEAEFLQAGYEVIGSTDSYAIYRLMDENDREYKKG